MAQSYNLLYSYITRAVLHQRKRNLTVCVDNGRSITNNSSRLLEKLWGTERLTTPSWQTTPQQSFMWGSGFTWLTFAIKYWNKCSEQGYGLQLHPSKWRHYMWNRAERRANRLSTVTSEGPVTCRASLLYKRVSLCPHGHKHLCVLNSIVLLTGKYVA